MVFTGIRWAALHYCFVGIVPALVACIMVRYAFRVRSVVFTIAASQHLRCMMPRYSWVRLVVRISCIIIALVLLWIALMRPQYRSIEQSMCSEQGRDVIIAVDISRSMLVDDCNNMSRLQRAKDKIAALVGSLHSERVALVVFADAATTLCPLTRDLNAFRMFVDMLDSSILSGTGSTSLAAALSLSAEMFVKDEFKNNRLLIMLTDGEDFVGSLEEAHAKAERVGLLVSVLGIGSTIGGPIPLFNEQGVFVGHQRDDQNAVVISKINPGILSSITARCHGLYQAVSLADDTDVAQIVAWVKAQEEAAGAAYAVDEYGELCMWLTGLSWCGLVLAWVL